MNLIIIPTYNERDCIADIITRVRTVLSGATIMVVDDASPDGTASVVEGIMRADPAILLMKRERKDGLGRAYLAAFARAHAMPEVSKIITMDADGSHDPAYLPEMIRRAASADLVIGSRYVAGGGVDNWSWHRRLLSRAGNMYCAAILGSRIADLTAGYVCLDRSVLDRIDLGAISASGYAYQIEFKYQCTRAGCTYVEMPIIFHERREGQSKMSAAIVAGGLLTPWRLRSRIIIATIRRLWSTLLTAVSSGS